MIVDKDWFFITHRLPLARCLQQQGAKVIVATEDTGYASSIRAEGFDWYPIHSSRNKLNPAKEIRLIYQISKLMGRIKPEYVHLISMKMILPGLVALAANRRPIIICSITGLGSLFLSRKRHLTQFLLDQIMRVMRGRILFIFQNSSDRGLFLERNWTIQQSAFLIRGSGVDPTQFQATPLPDDDKPIVLFASRLTAHKGIYEFARAATHALAAVPEARFQIAGRLVYDNPSALTQESLNHLITRHPVEYLGNITNMPALLQQASLVVLPTHGGEGVPKVLIEAAFMGRPIVATKVPGCSDIVEDGLTGLLVPPRDSEALSNAITSLLQNRSLMQSMGENAKKKAMADFSLQHVIQRTLEVYHYGSMRPVLPGKMEEEVSSNIR